MRLKNQRFLAILSILLLSVTLLLRENPVAAAPPEPPLIQDILNQTGGNAKIGYTSQTGQVSFIGTDTNHAIPKSGRLPSSASSEDVSRQFLATYGSLFGLSNQAQELKVEKTNTLAGGVSFVRFQQVYQGIPVFGGELIVQTDANKNILSSSGKISPFPQVNVTPSVDAAKATALASDLVTKKYKLDASDLVISTPQLWIYNPALLDSGMNKANLVWRVEVTTKSLQPVDQLVLVDAQLGAVALSFNQMEEGLNRTVYNANNGSSLPGTLVRSEGGPPTGDADADNAYDFAGDTYNYYFNLFHRDSVDNHGLPLKSTVHYCPNNTDCPYANAFWNGQQMVYGTTYASALDVVGHELTHGVTGNESHLFYYMQSGAINEALSDIFGNLVQHYYNPGGDPQWLMGENLPIGAIRSMSNPPAYSQPDKMSSTYYECSGTASDNGGVHTNSGVANKAAYLMIIGGSFNGKTVAALGPTKTAQIWYYVQTNLLTSGGDYQDLFHLLPQAAGSLVGQYGITTNDVQQVVNAVLATEMNQDPAGCSIPAATISCAPGQAVSTLFFDNMENPASGNWTKYAVSGSVNEWYYPQTANPYNFDATYTTSGKYELWGYDSDSRGDFAIAMTRNVTVPTGRTTYLYFNHAYDFEYFFNWSTLSYVLADGGIVEYSTNNGASWNDAVGLFVTNGYDGQIYSGGDNPLKGRNAFTGYSFGYTSSKLDLSSLAGQNVRFRFRIATDTGNSTGSTSGIYGWFIDDLRVYTCAPVTPRAFVPVTFRTTPSGW